MVLYAKGKRVVWCASVSVPPCVRVRAYVSVPPYPPSPKLSRSVACSVSRALSLQKKMERRKRSKQIYHSFFLAAA